MVLSIELQYEQRKIVIESLHLLKKFMKALGVKGESYGIEI
jgi:hypothetical protein